MITIDEKIARTERLLRKLEEEQPYLHARVSMLSADHRNAVVAFAESVRVGAEAELARLIAERGLASDMSVPQPAD